MFKDFAPEANHPWYRFQKEGRKRKHAEKAKRNGKKVAKTADVSRIGQDKKIEWTFRR